MSPEPLRTYPFPFINLYTNFSRIILELEEGIRESVILVERSRNAHPHETDTVLLEPLVADLLRRHEEVPDAGLQNRQEITQKRGLTMDDLLRRQKEVPNLGLQNEQENTPKKRGPFTVLTMYSAYCALGRGEDLA